MRSLHMIPSITFFVISKYSLNVKSLISPIVPKTAIKVGPKWPFLSAVNECENFQPNFWTWTSTLVELICFPLCCIGVKPHIKRFTTKKLWNLHLQLSPQSWYIPTGSQMLLFSQHYFLCFPEILKFHSWVTLFQHMPLFGVHKLVKSNKLQTILLHF